MNITKATYGDIDVLDIVRSKIKNSSIKICPSNNLFSCDPKPGILKYLNLTIDNIDFSIKENEYFEYPIDHQIKKLGIFYTNNNLPKVVEYCLHDLIKFDKKADIISCVWKHIPNNPFYEQIAYTKSPNHLNISIQILQLLYVGREHKKYDYVSFMEHDVLYPMDYFDFEDIDSNYNGLINQNYIGLCYKGFQQKNQKDQPLHQITMRFDNAIGHFERMILKAIKERNVILEPNNLQIRSCKNPSLHINHGQHFTSHFSIYSKSNIHEYESEWGNGYSLMKKIMGT